MSKKITAILGLIIWLLPIVYLMRVYPSLPKIIPLHYGAEGLPDRFGDKFEIIETMGFMNLINLLVFLLIINLKKIDPKRTAEYSAITFNKMALLLVFFISTIQFYIIHISTATDWKESHTLYIILGVFFMLMGNLMHSIKHNYFVGIRTPWTLESEDNWRATHQLGSKVWFIGGLIIVITNIFVPARIGFIIFISATIIMALIPIIYSYVYFKSTKK